MVCHVFPPKSKSDQVERTCVCLPHLAFYKSWTLLCQEQRARFAVKGWASNSMAATKQQRLKHLDLLVRKRKKKAVDSYLDNFIDNGATTLGK